MMSEKKGAVNSPASASMPWAIIVPRNQVTLRARITKLVTNSGMISLTQRAAAISRITSATWLGAGIPHAPKTSSPWHSTSSATIAITTMPVTGFVMPVDASGHGHAAVQVHVLDRPQKPHAFLHRTLESLAA
jgi:hypothetical protein